MSDKEKKALPSNPKLVAVKSHSISPDSPLLKFIPWKKELAEQKLLIEVGQRAIPKEYLDGHYKATKDAFIKFLNKHLQPPQEKPVSCFISYAWGDPYVEYWVEQLAILLQKAGFVMYLDKWHDRMGKQLTAFVEEALEKSNFFLVVGTPLYLQKYKRTQENPQKSEHIVRAEVRIMNYIAFLNEQKSNKIVPILLQGEAHESLPLFFRANLGANFATQDYFQELWRLICSLYNISHQHPIQQKFQNFLAKQAQRSSKTEYKQEIDQHAKNRREALIKNDQSGDDSEEDAAFQSQPSQAGMFSSSFQSSINVPTQSFSSSLNSNVGTKTPDEDMGSASSSQSQPDF